jgi:PAS domain S-box-containing protein
MPSEAVNPSVLEAALTSLREGVLVTDAAGAVVFANAAAARLLREPSAALSGQRLEQLAQRFLTGEGRPLPAEALPFRRVLQTGAAVPDLDLAVTVADGDYAQLNCEVRPHGAGGLVIVLREVSAARRDEHVRARQQATLRSFLERLEDAAAVHREGRLVYANPAAARLLGYESAEAMVGLPVLDLVHPDDRATVLERIHAMINHGETVGQRPERFLHRDGRAVPVLVAALPVMFEHEAAIAVFARDETARVQAEAERDRLLALEQQHAAEWEGVLSSIADAVWVFDPRGCVTFTNEAARRLTGAPSTEELHQPLADLGGYLRFVQTSGAPLAPEDLPPARALRGETLPAEELCLTERTNGSRRCLRTATAPIRDHGGHVVGAVLVASDITALKDLERSREEFVSIVAHDLRTPITAILGFASLLERRAARHPTDEQQRKAVDSIMTSARRLNGMVSELLDLSRIESRRLVLAPEPVELPAQLHAAVERMRPVLHDHPLRVDGEVELPPLSLDPARIEQVLINLLTNAASYSPAGSEIAVTVEQQGDEAVVSVLDGGIGIPPEEQAHLFEPFHRTRDAAAHRRDGLGVGLHISKGLIEAHGGRIWVESAPGQGSAFRFALPLHPAPRPST